MPEYKLGTSMLECRLCQWRNRSLLRRSWYPAGLPFGIGSLSARKKVVHGVGTNGSHGANMISMDSQTVDMCAYQKLERFCNSSSLYKSSKLELKLY